MRKISTPNAPSAIGPYSQAVIYENLLFTSGQIPLDPKTMQVVEGGIKEQTLQVMKNIEAILLEANSGFDKVIKTTCFLKNISDFSEFNEVYKKFFVTKP
ncbi:MAG: regulator, partial [Clostridiaceae bacterium]|nr:regulator [Clostridiaceae bacterium]